MATPAGNSSASAARPNGSCARRPARSWWCAKRNTSFVNGSPHRKNTEKTIMNAHTEIEPMATRVALHPFLVGMNRKQLALLTDCAMVVQFKKGQVIFREGDIANRFYLIETGKVILESSSALGDPVVIDTIGAGDLLGWSWMFPPCVWHFTARAAEPVTAIFFYG